MSRQARGRDRPARPRVAGECTSIGPSATRHLVAPGVLCTSSGCPCWVHAHADESPGIKYKSTPRKMMGPVAPRGPIRPMVVWAVGPRGLLGSWPQRPVAPRPPCAGAQDGGSAQKEAVSDALNCLFFSLWFFFSISLFLFSVFHLFGGKDWRIVLPR